MEKRSLKAGKAYIEAIQGNPSARKSLEHVLAKLHLLAKALESIDYLARNPVKMLQKILQDTSNFPELVAEEEMDISALALNLAREWENEYGVPYPETIEDVNRLISEAELEPKLVLAGEFTFQDAMPIIEGYLKRICRLRSLVNQLSGCPVIKDPENGKFERLTHDMPVGITCRKAYKIITSHHPGTRVTLQAMSRHLERNNVPVLGRVDGDTRVFACDQAFKVLMKAYDPLTKTTPAARRNESASLKRRFQDACIPVERLA